MESQPGASNMMMMFERMLQEQRAMSEIAASVERLVQRNEQFNGKDVTRYLWDYKVEMLRCGIVEIQAQHRPKRLKKPRTESVWTDRLGRVPSRLGEPMTRRKIFRKEYIFGSLCRRSLRALKYDSTSVSPPKDLYKKCASNTHIVEYIE